MGRPVPCALLAATVLVAALLLAGDVSAQRQPKPDPHNDHNLKDMRDVDRRLFVAAAEGRAADVKRLIHSEGADVNAKCARGFAAMHAAAKSGHADLIFALNTDHKADLEEKDNMGRTPLHWAAFSGNIEAIKTLMSLGANIEARDLAEETPLHRAAGWANLETVKTLYQFGADTEARDHDGHRPLDSARRHMAHNIHLKPIVDWMDSPEEL